MSPVVERSLVSGSPAARPRMAIVKENHESKACSCFNTGGEGFSSIACRSATFPHLRASTQKLCLSCTFPFFPLGTWNKAAPRHPIAHLGRWQILSSRDVLQTPELMLVTSQAIKTDLRKHSGALCTLPSQSVLNSSAVWDLCAAWVRLPSNVETDS